MASTDSPRRVVLRFNSRYDREEPKIIAKYLAMTQPREIRYFVHSIPSQNSAKAHTVLDLHCDQCQTVNIDEISYEVFLVEKKEGDFVLRKLDEAACERARKRCGELDWGTDRR
ncbi:hypothetical protein PMIN03_011533 [Paraphaeosphaeria minitans]